MADEENLIEIKDIRKRRMFLELIENTRNCCLVWSQTLQKGQFKSSKAPYEFFIAKFGSEIILDVLKDCKFKTSYRSSVYSDISEIYTTIEQVFKDAFTIIPDEEEALLDVLKNCRCTYVYEDPSRGGVVIGGCAWVHLSEDYFEVGCGGVVVGGCADSGLIIGPDTYIYIWFDSSGSMNSTLAPLTTMKNTLLKDALLPFYEDDGLRYDEKVSVLNYPSERSMDVIHRSKRSTSGHYDDVPEDYVFPADANNVVILWFQDESSPYGADISFPATRDPDYTTDIGHLRNRLETEFSENFYRAVFFHVEGYSAYKHFLREVENATTGEYAPPYGLSDREEFVYKYDITDGGTPEYYLEQVLLSLEELGFTVR